MSDELYFSETQSDEDTVVPETEAPTVAATGDTIRNRYTRTTPGSIAVAVPPVPPVTPRVAGPAPPLLPHDNGNPETRTTPVAPVAVAVPRVTPRVSGPALPLLPHDDDGAPAGAQHDDVCSPEPPDWDEPSVDGERPSGTATPHKHGAPRTASVKNLRQQCEEVVGTAAEIEDDLAKTPHSTRKSTPASTPASSTSGRAPPGINLVPRDAPTSIPNRYRPAHVRPQVGTSRAQRNYTAQDAAIARTHYKQPAFGLRSQWKMFHQGPLTYESNQLQLLIEGDSTMLSGLVGNRSLNNVDTIAIRHVVNDVVVVAQDETWDDEEVDNVVLVSRFSAWIDQIIGATLMTLNVCQIDSFSNLFNATGMGREMDMSVGSGRAENMVNTTPSTIMCVPTMVDSEYRTTLFNPKDQEEFILNPLTGHFDYNPLFWANTIQYRSAALHGHPLKYIPLAAEVHTNFLNYSQHADHIAGYTALRQLNAQVPTKSNTPAVRCRLYGVYAHIFNKIMTIPIVGTARSHHYKPVLLLRNVLLRRNHRENHFEITSLDKGNVTTIHLVGFARQNSKKTKHEFLIVKGHSDKLATIYGEM